MTSDQDPVEVQEFALLLKGILWAWRRSSGVSTEYIANQIGLADSSALRAFLSEKKVDKTYRKDNRLIIKIKSFLDIEISSIKDHIGLRRHTQYVMMTQPDSQIILPYFCKTQLKRISSETIGSFNDIVSNYFGANYAMEYQVFPQIKGSYYCYRLSSYGGSVIKSVMTIARDHSGAAYFEHFHPDRHHETTGTSDGLRETVGNIFQTKENIYMIANSGANQGVTFYAMKLPYSIETDMFIGYVVCPSPSRKIVSSRTIFIKDDKASPKEARRISIDPDNIDARSKELGFKLDFLTKSPPKLTAEALRSYDELLYQT